MEKGEELQMVLELKRRIDELREIHGAWLDYEIDRQEWTLPKYAHQN